MVHLTDEEEPHYDDFTIGSELQQFIDEWHYRTLHSGLAHTWDRTQCLRLAIEMFRMHGMEITDEEEEQYVLMEDEAEMVRLMVNHIPMAARKTFEHFVLQLQLVVSSTTQVRHALASGDSQEVARCFDGGESGPGSQILKQCIIEAGKQIHEAVEMHKSWKANTETRIQRLARSQDDAEDARRQLEAVQAQLDAFHGDQKSKNKSVLVSMADKNDKTLLKNSFSSWVGWLLRHQMDKDIHDKFKQEIQDAEDALINFKQKQLGISKGMLNRTAAQGDSALQAEVLRIWYKHVIEEGNNKEMNKALEEAQAKFAAAQQSSKDASKSVLNRMSAGNDQALLTLCWGAWTAALEELKKDREIDALAKAAEQQYKDFMSKKSGEARGVLDRMSCASDSGLVQSAFKEWLEVLNTEKEGRKMEELMAANEAKFKSLNSRQKGNAKSVASKCHQQEEENMIMIFFFSWSTEAREQRVIKVYDAKLKQKGNQLEQVQTMFRSFANQLESGIGNTPRSKKSTGRSRAEGSTVGA